MPSFKAKDLWFQYTHRATQPLPSAVRHLRCPRKEALVHQVTPCSPLSLWTTDPLQSLQICLFWALWTDGFHNVWSLIDLPLNTTMSKFIPTVVNAATPCLFVFLLRNNILLCGHCMFCSASPWGQAMCSLWAALLWRIPVWCVDMCFRFSTVCTYEDGWVIW